MHLRLLRSLALPARQQGCRCFSAAAAAAAAAGAAAGAAGEAAAAAGAATAAAAAAAATAAAAAESRPTVLLGFSTDITFNLAGLGFGAEGVGSAGLPSRRVGTVLREVDTGILSQVLTPNKEKLKSKGVDSVAARIVNLKEIAPTITHENLCASLRSSFFKHFGSSPAAAAAAAAAAEPAAAAAAGAAEPAAGGAEAAAEGFEVEGQTLISLPVFQQHLQTLRAWEWVFSKTPAFSCQLNTRFDWASLDVGLVVDKGFIQDCIIYSDCLSPDLIEAFSDALKGAAYTAAGIHAKITGLRSKFPGHLEKIDQFAEWLAEASQS
ncbi:lipoate-protein ligase a, putative [Eimeria brunetti]|uniref:lipoate--protein ligase n=1 Tax=Eimeria brunetti TaxID=51314 RepID=U6LIC3_9EIME|nr:lipoate-protein ligase a, putative [Eimeria brunetti]